MMTPDVNEDSNSSNNFMSKSINSSNNCSSSSTTTTTNTENDLKRKINDLTCADEIAIKNTKRIQQQQQLE